jgi:serine/threonine protein kinase/Tfp pilus assembly protein PilF
MIKYYEDFEVIIIRQGDQLYADLGTAPGGRHLIQPIPVRLPKDDVAWAEAYQGRKNEAQLAEIGYRLFEAIITEELEEKWHACLGETGQRDDIGIRLRFSLQANVLTQVPLELLCVRTHPTHEFLALDPSTPVVRSPRFGGAVRKRPVAPPLRMLAIIANPVLEEPTDPVAQQKSLEEALIDLVKSRDLMIDYLGLPGGPTADYDALHHTLVQTEYPFDVVHFVGHGALPVDDYGEREGCLLFVDPKTGRGKGVPASRLGILADSGVRVVVLQACDGARDGTHSAFQGIAQQLIARGLPAAVALQCTVDKDVASWFCRQFYDFWLGKGGLPLEYAVTEARRSVQAEFGDRASAWMAPVLFIREGSTDLLKLDASAHSPSAQLKRGIVLLERGQIDAAVDELEKAHQQAPDQARHPYACALVAQAQMLKDKGDEDGALEKCEQALKVSPERQTALSMKREIEEEIKAKKQVKLRQAQGESELESSEAAPEGWPSGHILGGKYQILKMLTTTARCEIYEAKDLRSHRPVAVKRLKRDQQGEADARERFDQEADILEQMDPRFVLDLLDNSETETGDRYFVTEFADEGSLRDYLEKQPNRKLSPIRALRIAKAVCRGLVSAHKHGIRHRDIKPGNIFLFSKPDGGLKVKLADFSIARPPKEWRDKFRIDTRTGTFLGTPPYAAPEQINGILSDFRSDLFSWAVVFLEMLTGKFLWEILAEDSYETSWGTSLTRYLMAPEDEFPSCFFAERGVPQEFIPLLQKALRYSPDDRYQSAKELQEVLNSVRYYLVDDIERHLTAGEGHIRALKWQEASAKFERGLELCQWYSEADEVSDQLEELVHRLEVGRLYAHGMLYRFQRQWQAAIEALEELQALSPIYLGIDITAELERAHLEQRREHAYNRIRTAIENERWTMVVRLADEFETSYVGPDGKSIDDIRKHALYAWGKSLKSRDPERVFYALYELYRMDRNYKDVAALCAQVAFGIGTNPDVSLSWEQKVEWLEKVIEIDPGHREGRTQKLLDRARHRGSEELLKEDKSTAVTPLERISSNYDRWTEVHQTLVNVYHWLMQEGIYTRTEEYNLEAEAEARYRLGMERWGKGDLQGAAEALAEIHPQAREYEEARSQLAQIYVALGRHERQHGHWQSAVEWWDKAINLSRSLKRVLRREIREANAKMWIQRNKPYIDIIGVVCAILAVVFAVWQLQGGWHKPPLATSTSRPAAICNGSFEDKSECWQHGGELDQTVKCDGDGCFAVLGNPDYECDGGVPVGEAWIKQSFQVPETASPTLSLRYRVFSYDLDLNDFFQVRINGTPLGQFGNTDWEESDCNREAWDSGWKSVEFDLSSYSGKRVEVSLHNVNGTDVSWNTWTYVDDVEIR